MSFISAKPFIIPGSQKLNTLEVCTLKLKDLIVEEPTVIDPLITD